MITTRPILMILALIAALSAGTAFAQGPPPGGPPPEGPPPGSPEWEEMMDRIATVRIFKLTQALDLDETTAIKLAGYLKDRDAERMELNANRGRMAREIKEFLDAGADDDARAKELLNEAVDLETRTHEAERELVEGLDGVLSPSQQLRFILANREFDREVREMIRQHRKERGGGPPGS
jgi:hypothetical protein